MIETFVEVHDTSNGHSTETRKNLMSKQISSGPLPKNGMWDLCVFNTDDMIVEKVLMILKYSTCDKFVDMHEKHSKPIRSNDRINFSNEVIDTTFYIVKNEVNKKLKLNSTMMHK